MSMSKEDNPFKHWTEILNKNNATSKMPGFKLSNIKHVNILLSMKGCVGSGKSTFVEKIMKDCYNKGLNCLAIGTDYLCIKYNIDISAAIKIIILLINKYIKKYPNCIIIIDTCGDNIKQKTKDSKKITEDVELITEDVEIFKVNFDSSWLKYVILPNYNVNNITGYLAFCLHNVRSRTEPHTLSLTTIKDEVKFNKIFIKKASQLSINGRIINNVIKMTDDELKEHHDKYLSTLNNETFEKVISLFKI